MFAFEAASEDFLIVMADWKVSKARQLVQRLDPRHVIVDWTADSSSTYFIYDRRRFEAEIDHRSDEETLVIALRLGESDASPVVSPYDSADSLVSPVVVVDGGRVVGVFDRPESNDLTPRRRYEYRTKVDDLDPWAVRHRTRHEQPAREEGEGGASHALPAEYEGAAQDRPGGREEYGTMVDDEDPWTPRYRTRHKQVAREDRDDETSRSLSAAFPETVPIGQTASLLISLVSTGEADAPALVVPDLVGIGETIDLVAHPKVGFELAGPMDHSITVRGGTSAPVQFKLKATTIGLGRIEVLAFHQGVSLGTLTVVATIVAAEERIEVKTRNTRGRLSSVTVKHPDMSMTILEGNHAGDPAFQILLASPQGMSAYGPIPFRTDPRRFFRELYGDVVDLLKEGRTDVARRMESKGAHLFEAVMPEELRELIWKLQSTVTTVQIQSDEPWIPWEICRLSGEEDGHIVEGPFFCEAFATTRWLINVDRQPELHLKNMALVVPRDSGLRWVGAERDYLLDLQGPDRSVTEIDADFGALHEAFASGCYDGWHFSGHGVTPEDADPNRTKIILENRETLMPEEISGKVRNLGLGHPLVFLNACEVGREGMSLTDIGGFASQFLNAGAGGFVGAYWEVSDKPALQFATSLYDGLLAGDPMGEAVHSARAAIKSEADPTWLAYTVYADPLACVA